MLSDSVWNSNLLLQFSAIGFIGTSVLDLTDALAKGFVTHIVGKPFVTSDVGLLGTGTGNGNGVGLTVASPLISSSIYASMLTKGFRGSQLLSTCQAIGLACNITLLLATLTSTHTLISGTGTVIPLTIGVSASGMSSDIQNSTTILVGDKFPDFCDAVAEGLVNAIITTAIGSVSITPNPPTATPGSPGTGTETGLGVIT